MRDAGLFLGIDVGTSGTKAVLAGAAGEVVATATAAYPLHTPRPLWAEQDPEDWWRGTVEAVRGVLEASGAPGRSVAAVGLTGQMHGLVATDAAGSVLRPAILWNDQRTGAECDEIHERLGRRRLLDLTGNPALPGFTAPKLLWMRRHEPEAYGRIAHVLLPKDYVRYRMTGERVTDVSDASGTALFDVAGRRWSDEVLDALEIPRAWLPEAAESPEVRGAVHGEAAPATGLAAGTPVVAGAGDQAASAVGMGLVAEGAVSVTLGTSGVVFAPTGTYRADDDGRLHAFCHAVPGTWHLMGVMLSAGGSLRWFRDVLGAEEVTAAARAGRDPYELLTELAAAAPPGCEGLTFLPYLTGERTPHADPDARGAYVGLTLRHGKGHLVRAVLEGVAYGLRDSLELIRGKGIDVGRVRLSGGGAGSALWRQILADVFRVPVTAVNATEGAAYGAALLAGVGGEAFPSVAAATGSAGIREDLPTEPGPAAEAYETGYRRYRDLYPALRPAFAAIARGTSVPAPGGA